MHQRISSVNDPICVLQDILVFVQTATSLQVHHNVAESIIGLHRFQSLETIVTESLLPHLLCYPRH